MITGVLYFLGYWWLCGLIGVLIARIYDTFSYKQEADIEDLLMVFVCSFFGPLLLLALMLSLVGFLFEKIVEPINDSIAVWWDKVKGKKLPSIRFRGKERNGKDNN